MRGYLLIEEKFKKKYFDNFFDAYWKDNVDLSNEKNVIKILEKCKIDVNFFYENTKQQKIKDEEAKKIREDARKLKEEELRMKVLERQRVREEIIVKLFIGKLDIHI